MPAALARFSPFAAYNIYGQLDYKIIYWSWQARDIQKIWFCHIIPQKANIFEWDEVLYWYYDQLMLDWYFESDFWLQEQWWYDDHLYTDIMTSWC